MLPIGRASPACTAQKRLKTNAAESRAGSGDAFCRGFFAVQQQRDAQDAPRTMYRDAYPRGYPTGRTAVLLGAGGGLAAGPL